MWQRAPGSRAALARTAHAAHATSGNPARARALTARSRFWEAPPGPVEGLVANALVGWFRGGLGSASVLASMFFATISGSSSATTAAIGSTLIPAMEKKGYPKPFAAATCAAAGELGVIIPPSIPMVISAGTKLVVRIAGLLVSTPPPAFTRFARDSRLPLRMTSIRDSAAPRPAGSFAALSMGRYVPAFSQ